MYRLPYPIANKSVHTKVFTRRCSHEGVHTKVFTRRVRKKPCPNGSGVTHWAPLANRGGCRKMARDSERGTRWATLRGRTLGRGRIAARMRTAQLLWTG